MSRSRSRTGYGLWAALAVWAGGLAIGGCHSPEDGRTRGGGSGGDGGNYRELPVHAPSKIDGTKVAPSPLPRALVR